MEASSSTSQGGMEGGGEQAMGGMEASSGGVTYFEGAVPPHDYQVCQVCGGATEIMTRDVTRKRWLCELCFQAWLAR